MSTNSKKKSRTIYNIVLALSIVTMLISGSFILFYYIDGYRAKTLSEELNNSIVTAPEGSDDSMNSRDALWLKVFEEHPELKDIDFPEGLNPKFAVLYAENNDFAGHIKIENTKINYNIVRHENDNEYYLHRDFFENYSQRGTIMCDMRSALNPVGQNTVIYGHHMKDGAMFRDLIEYETVEGYLGTSPVIYYSTPYEDYVCKIYACYLADGSADINRYFFDFTFTDASEDSFSEYIKEIDKRKFYTTGVDLLPTDKILTLYTCSYDFDNARTVLVARFLREGESEYVDTSNITVNNNRKLPLTYYNEHGIENPFAADTPWYPSN